MTAPARTPLTVGVLVATIDRLSSVAQQFSDGDGDADGEDAGARGGRAASAGVVGAGDDAIDDD